jgi:hypothetical protein
MAKITQGSLTGPKKPSSMTTVGDLKKTVRNMRRENVEREDYRTMLQKNINNGMPDRMAVDAVKDMQQMRKEKAYYTPIIDRYQGLIDAKTKGRDTPLPSSEGLFDKIKGYFK